MIVKFIGCLTILFSATAGGYMMAGKFAGRVRDLRAVQEGLNMLESEILFTSTPLPEALHRTAERLEKPVNRIFSTAAQILDSRMGYTAGEAWSMAFERNRDSLYFNGEDLDIIKNFGKSLGSTDKENQEKNFRLVRLQLNSQQIKAEEERSKNERMYRNLGFLFGATIIILLV